MSSIRWQHNNPDIYLRVNSRWYRYDSTAQPVGIGAMGVVYLGFDCATHDKVAVKMLRQELWSDLQIRDRFKLEASIILHHPNVIHMIGYCEDDRSTGPLYVLSEYICGVTFEEHVQQLSYLDISREERYYKIVLAFYPALDAVKCLHSNGIIHRDIKPKNLMLQDGCQLKLMDLGIAKKDCFFDAHLKGFIGSQPFAAPEQVVNDNVEAIIDTRADIYSLGVTLAYLLVGHYPLLKVDKVPNALSRVICKATAYDPELRYQSTDEMSSDLDIFMENFLTGKTPKTNILPLIFLIGVFTFLIIYIVTLWIKLY